MQKGDLLSVGTIVGRRDCDNVGRLVITQIVGVLTIDDKNFVNVLVNRERVSATVYYGHHATGPRAVRFIGYVGASFSFILSGSRQS